MLVLSRKPGEKLLIGSDIVVTVVEVKGNRVRLGVSAPAHVQVLRGELADTWDESAVQPAFQCSSEGDTAH